MAKVYFYYSAMNAGKTTHLLQARYNYIERGMKTICLKPATDTRDGVETIKSRIGLEAPCYAVQETESLYTIIKEQLPAACVLIDEAQFLNEAQVIEICKSCDDLDIPILCYGLRSDFTGKPFPGSAILLAQADILVELKTICHCGKKATMNLRLDECGIPVHIGNQVLIGGNAQYVAVCRKHFYRANTGIIG